MSKKLFFILLLFIYFNPIILNLLPNQAILSLWDESLTIVLFFVCILKIIINNGRLKINTDLKFLYPWFVMACIGVVGNLIWHYEGTGQAIVRDIVGFLKFPICFFSFRFLKLDKKICDKSMKCFVKFLHYILMFMLMCAIISLFVDIGMAQSDELRHGINSFQFLFNHPNTLGITLVMILCILDSCSYLDNKRYIIICLILLCLTMRTKILAFVAVYIFIKFGGNWAKKYRFLFILGSIVIIFAVAFNKLMIVTSWTESGRMRFWTESFNLMKKCFPIGTGFGTFASHVSGKYHSRLYSIMHIKEIFDEYGNPTAVIGDTGYPYYISQFGFLGIILLIYSFTKLYKIIKLENKKNNSALYLLIYILIALSGESTLINGGVELAITLSLVIYNSKICRLLIETESN